MANQQDEYLNLVFQVKGQQAIVDAQAALGALPAKVSAAGAAFQAGAISGEEFDEELRDIARDSSRLKDEIDGLQRISSGNFLTSPSGLRNVQQLNYGLQDILSTSGDLGAKLSSASNNFQEVLGKFGPWGIAASALLTVGIKIYQNWDQIARLFESKTGIPQAADDVSALKRELDRAKEGMEKLEKQGTLTRSELEKYNELRKTSADLEERVAKAQERQEALKKLKGLQEANAEEQKKENAKIVQEALGGHQGDVTASLAVLLSAQNRQSLFQERRNLQGQIANTPAGVNRIALERELRQVNARIRRGQRGEDLGQFQSQAQGMLAMAAQGDQAEIARALGLMQQSDRFAVGGPLEWIRVQFQEATAAGAKRRRQEQHDIEQQKKQADADKARTQELLQEWSQGNAFDAQAKVAAEEAGRRRLSPEAAYAFIREAIERAIRGRLGEQGIQDPDRKPVEAAAGQIAREGMAAAEKARKDEDQRRKKEAGDQAAARKQQFAKEFAEEKSALEDQIKETGERQKAEAKRIRQAFGKEVSELFAGATEDQAIAIAAMIRNQFQQLGFTAGGSGLAARQFAEDAGFAVSDHQLAAFTAQAQANRPRRRGGNGNAFRSIPVAPVNDVAGVAPGAGNAVVGPPPRGRRRRRPVFRPLPNTAGWARPPALAAAQAGRQQSGITAYDRQQARIRAATQARVAAAVKAQDAAKAVRAGRGAAAIAAARVADATRRAGAEATKQAALQRAGYLPAPAAVGQLGAAQGANQQKLMHVAATQNAAIAGLINQQQRQGADIQQLLGDASRARRHLTENGPTAQNNGNRP